MSPTTKAKLEDDVERVEADVEGLADDPQVTPNEVQTVIISVNIVTSFDDPEVTAETVKAALVEQITLPTSIWVSKTHGQAQVTIVGVEQIEEPPV